MVILEKPFVSGYLINTLIENQAPVLKTQFAESLPGAENLNLLPEKEFFRLYMETPGVGLYSNSEDSAAWVYKNIPESGLASGVKAIKDKHSMREVFARLNPGYFFRKLSFNELQVMDVTMIPKPFVVKPVKGIASIGIRAVFSDDEWPEILRQVEKDRKDYGDAFSDTVMDLDSFLVEAYIQGQEIAVDAFFDHDGNPVIVNIMEHDFASAEDNSDRLYKSSVQIMKRYLQPVENYLSGVSAALGIKNFPMHMEMRITPEGEFIPIEINPMRFAGFCTTDIASYAYGINPYNCFLEQKSPDWNAIMEKGSDDVFVMGVIDIPRNLDKHSVNFDYELLQSKLSEVLELRTMDYRIFPMAAFIFARSEKKNHSELQAWLHDDMSDVITKIG